MKLMKSSEKGMKVMKIGKSVWKRKSNFELGYLLIVEKVEKVEKVE
jgi:hypothetical protein